MNKFWKRFMIIAPVVLTIVGIVGIVFAYGRRFLDNLSFGVDLELKVLDWGEGYLVAPLIIYVDNKNRRSVTLRQVELQLYSKNNVLIAESNKENDVFFIEGFKNNQFKPEFKVYLNNDLKDILLAQIQGEETFIYVVITFTWFLIPISRKEQIIF